MLTFVCFKWKPGEKGFQLPSAVQYGAHHVNVLRSMLARHVHVAHQLICVTDDADGIESGIEIVPLWDKCRDLGGCYNRLWVFSKEAGDLFGDRFVCIDLDVVLVADCTPLFTRTDEFVMNTYNGMSGRDPDQHYNGGLFMMTAGARASVWNEFDPLTTPGIVQADPDTIGTDQAWIRHHLGKGEARWSNADGVYEARQVRDCLPADARIVLFAGNRDPSTFDARWCRENWR